MPPIEIEPDETERTAVIPVETAADLAASYWAEREAGAPAPEMEGGR